MTPRRIKNAATDLEKLQRVVVRCRKCPRLVDYLKEVSRHKPKRFSDWDYWAKPLPSFGDPGDRVLIVGLAPAANGGNRTGRMFTGDRSGEWLFGALHKFHFANRPNSLRLSQDSLIYNIPAAGSSDENAHCGSFIRK